MINGVKEMGSDQSRLVDIAVGKPVVYLETPIVQDGKALDQRYNFERYSVNAGLYPSRLTDGNPSTRAYPASWFFDYVIDLGQVSEVKEIRLVWGSYGKEPNYITEWRLYGQESFSQDAIPNIETQWTLIQDGGYPNSEVTVLRKEISAKRFRIYAASLDHGKGVLLNWIGMTEFEAYVEGRSEISH